MPTFLDLLRLAAEPSLVALRATHDDDAHNPLPHLLFSVHRGELAATKLSSYDLCVRCVLANVSERIVDTKDIKVVIWYYYQIRRIHVTYKEDNLNTIGVRSLTTCVVVYFANA